jgi:hypothetical protein
MFLQQETAETSQENTVVRDGSPLLAKRAAPDDFEQRPLTSGTGC